MVPTLRKGFFSQRGFIESLTAGREARRQRMKGFNTDTSRKAVCPTCQWTREDSRPLAYHETHLRTTNKNN
ncbi:unnamed protein product [Gulo gulo]|uniref:Uncharacterized protein n=1 Tax=Gulo gulo TaxID=48420 RepID=A0A9X9LFQ0_GULGU|nr:unnamed protein product [Gulo gulo]